MDITQQASVFYSRDVEGDSGKEGDSVNKVWEKNDEMEEVEKNIYMYMGKMNDARFFNP